MNIIDTRDLEKERQDLEYELEGLVDEVEVADTEVEKQEAREAVKEWHESEDGVRYKELCVLREEIREWDYGETLIAEDDFTEYCQELLSDIGDLPRNIPWYIEIDWEKTADNLKADYSEVELDGTTYLYRE